MAGIFSEKLIFRPLSVIIMRDIFFQFKPAQVNPIAPVFRFFVNNEFNINVITEGFTHKKNETPFFS